MKLLKLIGVFVLLSIIAMFLAKRISKGIGNSLEDSIRSVIEVSTSIDSTDKVKNNSLKEAQMHASQDVINAKNKIFDTINCSDVACEGMYSGPEFVEGSDIAHQFSNTMAAKVGNKLKELYNLGEYAKVDFSKIEMSTVEMGSGEVDYKLRIPFIKVKEKCFAYTSFDHVGGWNHKPDLPRRKEELKSVLMKGQTLVISELKSTPEGLQEYWIQWKNKEVQSECK